MKKVLAIVGGVALAAALAAPQNAQANLLTNGSLETTVAADRYDLVTATSTTNSNALAGWAISGEIDVVPNTYWQASAGNYSVDMIGSPGLGKITQSVSTNIGDTYLLTFELAYNPQNLTGEAASVKHLVIKATSSSSAIDGTQTFSGTAPGGTTLTNLGYTVQTFTFTATSTLTTLSLAATMPSGLPGTFNANNVFSGPIVDDLNLTDSGSSNSGVPEPASVGLLGLGVIGLLRRRSRRRTGGA